MAAASSQEEGSDCTPRWTKKMSIECEYLMLLPDGCAYNCRKACSVAPSAGAGFLVRWGKRVQGIQVMRIQCFTRSLMHAVVYRIARPENDLPEEAAQSNLHFSVHCKSHFIICFPHHSDS